MSAHQGANNGVGMILWKNFDVQNILRRIIVSSMNSMGQFSPCRPSIEGNCWTPKGELLMMIYAHCHSSYFHVNSMILKFSTWPKCHVTTDNGLNIKQRKKIYMYQTYKLVSESVLSKYPLCGKHYRTWLNLQSVWQSFDVPIYKDSGVLMNISKCLNVLSEEVDKTQR